MMLMKEHEATEPKRASVGKIIFWIVVMNLVFSFDSILSAMALTSDMKALKDRFPHVYCHHSWGCFDDCNGRQSF